MDRQVPEFKPVNISLETFDVKALLGIDLPANSDYRLVSLVLRWWAIPANQQALQKREEEP